MLLSENFIRILVKGYQTCPSVVAMLFSYDKELNRLEILPGKAARNRFIYRSKFFGFLGALMIFRLKGLNRQGIGNWVETYMSLMMFFVYLLIAERYRVRGKYPEEFTSYFNAAIQIESKHAQGLHFPKHQGLLKLTKFYFFGTRLFCQYMFPILAALTSAVNPSIPLNSVWLLETIGYPHTSNGITTLAKFMFNFVANFCIWEMMSIQGYCANIDILVGVLSLNFSHDVVHRKFTEAIQKRASDNSNEIFYEFSLYRSFHLLVERYNDAIRTTLFSILFTAGVGQVGSAAALIMQTPQDGVPFVMNIFFVGVIIQVALLIVVVYGFCGNFYSKYVASMTSLRRKVKDTFVAERRQRKLFERFLRSCQNAKIKFGLSNFIEKRTPALFQMFCVERIIDILLVKK